MSVKKSNQFPRELQTSAAKLTDRQKIGAGGFGVVYVATHADWGKVAFKQLPQDFIRLTDKAVLQMVKEVNILKDLRHPQIIRLTGVVFEEGCYGILLEYMKHGSVHEFLQDYKVPVPWKIQLTYDVVLGMNYLHSQTIPIIHGDLKIHNILVTDGYQAKISDFGLSSWKQMSRTTSNRTAAPAGGTVTHIPPEKLRDINLPPNEAADVYAFGVFVWEMFTGETPFGSNSDSVIRSAVIEGQRPDLKLLDENTPSFIHDLIRNSWHQDPTQRKSFPVSKGVLERYVASHVTDLNKSKFELQEQERRRLSDEDSRSSLELDGASSLTPLPPLSSALTNSKLPISCCDTGSAAITESVAVLPQASVRHGVDDVRGVHPTSSPLSPDPSLCSGEVASLPGRDANRPNHLGQNQLMTNSFRPVQEKAWSSVEDSELRDIISLHPSSFSLSHPVESRVTQPKSFDRAAAATAVVAATVAAAAAASGPRPLVDKPGLVSLGTDSSSPVVRLQSSPLASHLTSQSSPAAVLEVRPEAPFLGGQNGGSLPEADAILSPETPPNTALHQQLLQHQLQQHQLQQLHQPLNHSHSSPEASELPQPFPGVRMRTEGVNASGSSAGNLDVNTGYYPKNGSSFQHHHVLPTNHNAAPPPPAAAPPAFQPTVLLPPWGLPVGPDFNRLGCNPRDPATHLTQALPPDDIGSGAATGGTRGGGTAAAAAAKQIDPGSDDNLDGPRDTGRTSDNSAKLVITKNGTETTIVSLNQPGSGIQIGDHNVMHINTYNGPRRGGGGGESGGGGKRTSANRSNPSPAVGAQVNPTRRTETRKIIVPDKLVDREALMLVSGNLSTDWIPLARHVGFSESDIDALRFDHHQMGVGEIAYQMLREWTERKGPAAKMDVLAKALVAIKRADIALKLQAI